MLVRASATGQTVPAEAGGGGSVNVADGGCMCVVGLEQRELADDASGASGSGAGTVTFIAAPPDRRRENRRTDDRRADLHGHIRAAGRGVLDRAGAAGGGRRRDNVQRGREFHGRVCVDVCENAPWISVRAAGAESGNGNVQVTIAPNLGAARWDRDNRRPHSHGQPGRDLHVQGRPGRGSRESGTSFERIDVQAEDGCTWTAVSNAPWIRVVGAAGSGDGSVVLAISENDDDRRIGTVTVAGQTVTVTQRKD